MDSVQLSREAVQQIRDLMREVKELRREVERLSGREVPRRLIDDILLAKPGSTIAAISGTSVSSGTATIYEVTEANQLASTSRTVTVYNWSGTALASGTTIVIGRCSRTGKWIVIAVDC